MVVQLSLIARQNGMRFNTLKNCGILNIVGNTIDVETAKKNPIGNKQNIGFSIELTRNSTLNLNHLTSQQAASFAAIKQKRISYFDAIMQDNSVSGWYSAAKSSTMQQFENVQQLINQGNYSAAKTANDAIQTNLLPEVNQKNFNTIFINHYLRMLNAPH